MYLHAIESFESVELAKDVLHDWCEGCAAICGYNALHRANQHYDVPKAQVEAEEEAVADLCCYSYENTGYYHNNGSWSVEGPDGPFIFAQGIIDEETAHRVYSLMHYNVDADDMVYDPSAI